MAQNITLGDNFEIDEDANGDLIIRDTTSNVVAGKYDRSADAWTFNDKFTSITTEDGTIGGAPILGMPSSTSDASLTLGMGWTTIDADQPISLIVRLSAQTDGTSNGQITLQVDESGGTSSDWSITCFADKNMGSTVDEVESFVIPLPAGAQIRILNTSDPNNANAIRVGRKAVMSS